MEKRHEEKQASKKKQKAVDKMGRERYDNNARKKEAQKIMANIRTKLDELVKDYENNQEEIKIMQDNNEKLRLEILNELKVLGQTKYISADNISATIQDKDMIRYINEKKIVETLKALKLDKLVIVKPNIVALNKELRANTVLAESLKPYYHDQKITALTVKPLKD